MQGANILKLKIDHCKSNVNYWQYDDHSRVVRTFSMYAASSRNSPPISCCITLCGLLSHDATRQSFSIGGDRLFVASIVSFTFFTWEVKFMVWYCSSVTWARSIITVITVGFSEKSQMRLLKWLTTILVLGLSITSRTPEDYSREESSEAEWP